MLGEVVAEEKGKVTGTRVLEGHRVEVSFQASGKMLGVAHTDTATYWSEMRPDGTMFGEGHGIIMTADGESATWKGNGVGRLTGRGMGVAWRGAVYYYSASAKLSRLNRVAAVFEYETDENGNTTGKVWEWS